MSVLHSLAAPFRALGDPEGRRGAALLFLAGGGLAMTVYAAYALWAVRKQPAYAFYLGLGALMLIGIVLTGFAGLLIKRTIKGSIGAASFEVSDRVPGSTATVAVTTAAPDAADKEES